MHTDVRNKVNRMCSIFSIALMLQTAAICGSSIWNLLLIFPLVASYSFHLHHSVMVTFQSPVTKFTSHRYNILSEVSFAELIMDAAYRWHCTWLTRSSQIWRRPGGRHYCKCWDLQITYNKLGTCSQKSAWTSQSLCDINVYPGIAHVSLCGSSRFCPILRAMDNLSAPVSLASSPVHYEWQICHPHYF